MNSNLIIKDFADNKEQIHKNENLDLPAPQVKQVSERDISHSRRAIGQIDHEAYKMAAMVGLPLAIEKLNEALDHAKRLKDILSDSVQQEGKVQDHRQSTLSPVAYTQKIKYSTPTINETELTENVMQGRDYTTPGRDRPVLSQRAPSLHLDKETLTREEVADIMYWLAERLEGQDPKDLFEVLAPQVVGQPNGFVTTLINTLGTILYGENNYIGPGKTGAVEPRNIIDVVTSVPVLSPLDAEARAQEQIA